MVWVGVSFHVVCTAAPWGAWTLVIAAAPLTARAAVAVVRSLYETYSYWALDVCQLSVYVTDGVWLRIVWRSTASLAMLGGANQDLRADVPARPLAGCPRRALDDAGDPRAAARSQAVQAPAGGPPGDREQPARRAIARTRGGRDHPQAHAPSSRRRRGL